MDPWVALGPTSPSFLSHGSVSFGVDDSGSNTHTSTEQANVHEDLPTSIVPLDFVSCNWAAVSPDSLESLEHFQGYIYQSLLPPIFSFMEARDVLEDVSEDIIEGHPPVLPALEPLSLRLPGFPHIPRESMPVRSRGANKENLPPILIEDITLEVITGRTRTRRNDFRSFRL